MKQKIRRARRPFAPQADRFTLVDNYVLDHVMPSVRPNAWKVLMAIIRATHGWSDGKGGRKQKDALSYSQLMERTGIVSPATISTAVKELVERGFVIVEPGKGQFTANTYCLNADFEVWEEAEVEAAAATENEVEPTTEIEVALLQNMKTQKSSKEREKENERRVEPKANGKTTTAPLTVLDAVEVVGAEMAAPPARAQVRKLSAKALAAGLTFESTLALWEACKARADEPAGAFVWAILHNGGVASLPSRERRVPAAALEDERGVFIPGSGWLARR